MNVTDPLVEAIAQGVVAQIKDIVDQRKSILPETDVMQMLGIDSRRRMAELRREGLRGHKVDTRHWVYFLDDVEAFVESRKEV